MGRSAEGSKRPRRWRRRSKRFFKDGGVQLVVVPVDYAENTRVLVDELRGHVPEIARAFPGRADLGEGDLDRAWKLNQKEETMSLKDQFADQLKSQTDIWQAQIKDYQEQLQ